MRERGAAMLEVKAEILHSGLLLPRTVEAAAVLAQVLQQRALAVLVVASAQRAQALVRLVLTEAVSVAMVLLQQASVP